ncbi:MAG: GNAT family N-acetyltransferase [Brevinematales bacterium]
MEEFFNKDAFFYQEKLIAKVYYWVKDHTPVVMFSVSNDSIKFKDEEKRKSIFEKGQFNTFPAVKIGRFGVNKDFQNSGIGTQALDYIKSMFVIKNKTGCRFITLDAYNRENTLRFYQKNGFQFYSDKDRNKQTRIMYFDLLPFFNTMKDLLPSGEETA